MTRPSDMTAMRQAIAEGRTTAAALVEQAIERATRANDVLNFIAWPTFERARSQARTPGPGPLSGAPILIKDMITEKGVPARWGSRALADYVAPEDGPFTRAIAATGAISIARSAMPELGMNVTTESPLVGLTRNPWSLEHSAGGSSGGAAAAVAAGVVAVAHASDGLGSIRHGAAPCGLVGLKPSRGRNQGEETLRAVTDLNVNGCVTRTVRDTAAWLAATQTRDPASAFPPAPLVSDPIDSALRIQAYSAVMRTGAAPDPSVSRVFAEAVRNLGRLGHRVEDASLPFEGPAAVQALFDVTEGMFARNLGLLSGAVGLPIAAGDLEHRSATLVAAGAAIDDARFQAAWRHLEACAGDYLRRLDQIDVWMTPTFGAEVVRLGEFSPDGAWGDQRERLIDYAGYCWIDNVAGTPAISLPLGVSDHGLPVGVQFATRPGGETLLLALAYQLEAALAWDRLKPPVWVGDD